MDSKIPHRLMALIAHAAKEAKHGPALLDEGLSTAGAERIPCGESGGSMSGFDSLNLALEGWFEHPLSDLPEGLRERVKLECPNIPWHDLSAVQRRHVVLQVDYQRDPATHKEQQFWWDFFQRMDTIKEQIAEWEAVATPTADDLTRKESRLAELQQELARMEHQEHQPRRAYYPEQNNLDGAADTTAGAGSHIKYIAYPRAMQLLADRFDATLEELAAWIWMGPKDGGLAAYVNANELDPAPRFHYSIVRDDDFDYLSPLMACWFREDEIARFDPADRYITGNTLIERWSEQPGIKPEAFIRSKIAESRLLDIHPLYGNTQGTHHDDVYWPPLASGLFALAHVEAIEAEDFGVDTNRSVETNNDHKPEIAREDPPGQVELRSPTDVFLAMENLAASEVSIAFVGDKAESGLTANNMLEISARGETRRIPLAALDLVDRRRGTLNSQATILVGMAHKKTLTRTDEKNAQKMTRLRKVFRKHLGIQSDPFDPHQPGIGWQPRFAIVDRRGVADERAKREAERRTSSFEKITDAAQFAENGKQDRPFEDDDDTADEWLKNNDSNK